MQDNDIALYNTCTDLVSLRRTEAFPVQLLVNKRPGDWVCVRQLCAEIGVAFAALSPDVFATWLPDPNAEEGYALIIFYDEESKWSMTAQYNRGRLQGSKLPGQAQQQANAPLPTGPCSVPQPR